MMPGDPSLQQTLRDSSLTFSSVQKLVEIPQLISSPNKIGAMILVDMLGLASSGTESLEGCYECTCREGANNLNVNSLGG